MKYKLKKDRTVVQIEGEVWRPIPEYGKYEVSSLGRVQSFVFSDTARIKKAHLARNGYLRMQFSKDGGKFTLHRVIAEAFIPNPNNLPFINHKNGIKTDNRVENLEWCDGFYNQQHALKTGLRKIRYGIHTSSARFDETQIKTIKLCLRDGMRSVDLAGYFKCNPCQIYNIKSGRIWATVTI